VEGRGVAPTCRAGEVDRGGCGDDSEWWRSQDKLRRTKEKGVRRARVKP
jgi:hypothetical protein